MFNNITKFAMKNLIIVVTISITATVFGGCTEQPISEEIPSRQFTSEELALLNISKTTLKALSYDIEGMELAQAIYEACGFIDDNEVDINKFNAEECSYNTGSGVGFLESADIRKSTRELEILTDSIRKAREE